MTLTKINDIIFIGDNDACFYNEKEGWAVIHACKDPCHKFAVGYRGSLSPSHPDYLIKEVKNNLYLNMVDMNARLKPEFTNPIISRAMEFMKNKINEGKLILIHCNMGLSRSPAIALIYLAKVMKSIKDDSYDKAKSDFLKIYPAYNPGLGIDYYLREYWKELDNL